ncbi:hypothetical protein K402DRAFT_7204 [Aulographum hederae CBS 113979]|uniref:Uncharacterized protein n=1 Tax=Aulographum hederae CBS 113979 TaxID=1176131 RepID=A0A6G1HHH7_9PEZI|nr:hypothetical protein K402DRAFT_7204 [Aulographum hederae CBS 113979]
MLCYWAGLAGGVQGWCSLAGCTVVLLHLRKWGHNSRAPLLSFLGISFSHLPELLIFEKHFKGRPDRHMRISTRSLEYFPLISLL